MAVLLETTCGDIVIDLFTERPKSKKTCTNVNLCKIKFYNYYPTGTGCGGESVYGKLYGDQASLFDASSLIYHSVNLLNCNYSLLWCRCNDLLRHPSMKRGVILVLCHCRINHTVILEDPFDDPADLPVPNRSPEPTKEQLNSGRIGAEEVINDTYGKEAEELDELLKEEAAKTQAILLEMVDNLPDAEVKPPENVLFVCKLNPMTIEEDLEIIFSRFGLSPCLFQHTDLKSGESLCYAFIEFEKNVCVSL
uniref:Peptidylprolyl isomerase like 4 n=1 Tax=Oncorhynchus kisutch TaxID=8019 RepID=A0A8C7DM42_ONCKI